MPTFGPNDDQTWDREAARESGPPNGTRHFCPVAECTWFHDVVPPNVDATALASVFGLGVMASVAHNQHLQRVEDELRAHLESHDVVDWARTIQVQKESIHELQRQLMEASSTLAELAVMPPTTRSLSTYEIAVQQGFRGSEAQWLEQLERPQREQQVHYAPEPETPRYTADLPTGVVGRKT